MPPDPLLQVPNAEPTTPWRSVIVLGLAYYAWTQRAAIRHAFRALRR